jgi:hypothetical protein
MEASKFAYFRKILENDLSMGIISILKIKIKKCSFEKIDSPIN